MSTKFTLHIDPVKVDREHKVLERSQLYGGFNPMVTKLEDLGIDSKQSDDQSFLYGNKEIGFFYTQCKEYVSNGEFPSITSIPCFYCTEPFSTSPLGIPISFTPSFYKDKMGCTTIIHNEKERQFAIKNDYDIYHRDYFEVDGNFCSFPCMLSYIKQHNDGPYSESMTLLKKMHQYLYQTSLVARWAPDIRLLKKFGGHLSIQEWRSEEGYKYVNIITKNKPVFTTKTKPALLVPVSKIYRYNGQK